MDLSKYRSLYVSETQENLEKLGQLLVELEANPLAREHIDHVFRLFHSIKGMSGTMGYSPMFDLGHQLEELMDRVRLGHTALDAQITDVLLAGVDRMSRWLEEIDQDSQLTIDGQTHTLHAAITSCLGAPQPVEASTPTGLVKSDQPPAEPGDLVIHAEVDPNSMDPGARAFVLHRKLRDLGEIIWTRPALATLKAGQLPGGAVEFIMKAAFEPAQVADYIKLMPEWHAVEVSRRDRPDDTESIDEADLLFSGDLDLLSGEPEPVTSSSEFEGLNFDSVVAQTFDSLPAQSPLEFPDAAVASPEDEDEDEQHEEEEDDEAVELIRDLPLLAELSPADSLGGSLELLTVHGDKKAAGIVHAPRPSRSIRVRTEWLDTMLDGLGDLLITSQRLWNLNQQQPRPAITQGLRELARSLGRIRGEALSVRMTPMSVLTSRLPRVVRDMGRQAGKQINLTVHGDNLQLDRAIIEGLDSPLTHLLRNAVEHGIESPELRRSRGKPSVGQLIVECERVRDEIIVRVQDDGGGIDRAQLIEKAARLGLLDTQSADPGERDLLRLISLPGLSTTDRAGSLSGRGVGMDAVIDSIGGLGGEVQVESEIGVGSRFSLRLPRTPGISKLLLVEADGQIFGLPLVRILNSDMFNHQDVERSQGASYVQHGDERYRLHHLRHLLGFARAESTEKFPGVLFRDGDRNYVLAVDRVVGQQDAVIKPLGPLLERIDGLLGVTIDAVGQPVFVVDVSRFPVVR